METLIELYDERAIENIIGPEVFSPGRVVYLCPVEIAQDKKARETLQRFLESRGLHLKTEFVGVSQYKSDRILEQLRQIAARYPDCAMDVTGGTDAALVAAGMFCSESSVPTFTWSRRRNRFYEIAHAPFADDLPCDLHYRVEEFFAMAGGTMRKGRVDNQMLGQYLPGFDPFFRLYLQYRASWTEQITFFQRISRGEKGGPVPLQVNGKRTQKGERGGLVHADPAFLQKLEELGFLQELRFPDEESVSFTFADEQRRAWLRDVGSVLELYMYKACLDAGIFDDVVSSAIVDWDGTNGHGSVSNEIDVVASRGIVPLFISCKTCEVKTEALNELSILKERFGGKGAKAAIVTTEPCNAAARHRAAQLGIAVMDLEELEAGRAAERLRVIMKVQESL